MSVLRQTPRHFHASCTHEVAHQGLARAIDASGLAPRLVGVSGAGCGALVHAYLDLPFVASPFGRGPSVARGLLLARPEVLPLLYLGDGELLGEGLADLFRAARAGARMLVVLIDNESGGAGPLPNLEGLREVGADDPEEVARVLELGLETVAREDRFVLVRVRGRCPAQEEGPAWQR